MARGRRSASAQTEEQAENQTEGQSAEDLEVLPLDAGSEDDLREQVATLQGEVAELREVVANLQKSGVIGTASVRPPPRPKPTGPNVPIMVRATDAGHHGRLRQPGDTFQIMSHEFSDRWMEKVEGKE